MRLALAWMSVWAAACLCGCASRGNVDMLESQLRRQEDQIFALRRDLKRAEAELTIARRESNSLRAQVADTGGPIPAPEQSTAFHRIESIALHKLMTGGLDRDGRPGHDHLAAVVMPLDSEGEVVKSPGTLSLELIDLSKDGPERRIGLWEYSPDETEKLWKRSLIGTGYAIQTPFQQIPQSERLTLHARLTTMDGRQFDTSSEMTVATAAGAAVARADRKRPASVARTPKSPSASPALNVPPVETRKSEAGAGELPPPALQLEAPPPNEPNPPPGLEESSQFDPSSAAEEGRVEQVSAEAPAEPDFELPPLERSPRRLRPSAPEWPGDAEATSAAPPVRKALRPTTGSGREKRPPKRGELRTVSPETEIDRQPISIPTSDRWTEFDRPTLR